MHDHWEARSLVDTVQPCVLSGDSNPAALIMVGMTLEPITMFQRLLVDGKEIDHNPAAHERHRVGKSAAVIEPKAVQIMSAKMAGCPEQAPPVGLTETQRPIHRKPGHHAPVTPIHDRVSGPDPFGGQKYQPNTPHSVVRYRGVRKILSMSHRHTCKADRPPNLHADCRPALDAASAGRCSGPCRLRPAVGASRTPLLLPRRSYILYPRLAPTLDRPPKVRCAEMAERREVLSAITEAATSFR